MQKLLFSLLILPVFIAATTGVLSGRIIGIKDGDTIVLLTDNKEQITIRLSGVDCPEKTQSYGTKAKQFTSDLVFNKQVTVKAINQDRYGRTIATVYLENGKILNNELVSAGFAWHYKQYSKDTVLENLQLSAQKARKGLWQDTNATAPWDFRHSDKAVAISHDNQSIDIKPVLRTYVLYNQQSGKYHSPSCKWATRCTDCIKMTTDEAVKKGGVPCKVCGGF